jgi:hypothetical protein
MGDGRRATTPRIFGSKIKRSPAPYGAGMLPLVEAGKLA